jgi:soluble lytic murein transglycosylase-like protein
MKHVKEEAPAYSNSNQEARRPAQDLANMRPMHFRLCSIIAFLAAIVGLTVPAASGQSFYSYLDKDGSRIFTNIPPSIDESAEGSLSSDKSSLRRATPAPAIASVDPAAYDPLIRKYADYYGVDASLVHSIIATESGFNPKAVSSKGARGLMQLMPETADRLGVEDIFDPEQNIQAGVRHFRSLLDMFDNDINLSLAAYNAGENLVRRLGRIPDYKETIDYVQSVTRRYKERRQYMQGREEVDYSRTFRYTDSAGVLHVTNIPPTR